MPFHMVPSHEVCRWQPDKRRGVHAFYGTYNGPNLKGINDASSYYFYEKRGGGRAFVSQWQPFDGFRFYSPFFNKRSPHLWELIDGSSLTY
uniref:TLDc domain-containing protein n=1 Tax=Heterorhabditis bacteriophora TaxID=37862 RepID=A0A1I7XM91_HETBA